MYSYDLIKNKFDIYRIASRDGSYMEVIPERGGIVTRLGLGGCDILYMDEETLMDTSKNVRGGIPVLFPICGYLKDATYSIGGRDYHINQHGFARLLPWKVESIQTYDDHGSITIVLEDSDYTYSLYPFHFKLSYRYTLCRDSLVIETEYLNKDDKDMPFYAGFHPYFYVNSKEDIEIGIPSKKYAEAADASIVDGKFDFSRDTVDAAYYDLEESSCHMDDRFRKVRIDMDFDSIYKYAVVWSLKGKDFVCVEPWMANVNAMNTRKDITMLPAGQSISAMVNISIKKY